MSVFASRPRWLLSRRTLLRGAGGAAVALPLLDVMVPRNVRAAVAPRLLVFFTPGGVEMDGWKPKGTETSFTLGSSLQPLERLKRHLVVTSGLELSITREGNGHPHSRGMGGLLTGEILPAGPYNTNGGDVGFSRGTSIDQYLGDKLQQGRKFKTIETAIRWPSDGTDGLQVHPWNTILYSAPGKPVSPATNPRTVFDRLFKDLTGTSAPQQRRSRRILDAVLAEYKAVASKVSAADKVKLDAHLTALDEVDKSLAAAGPACTVPDLTKELAVPFASGSDQGGDGDIDEGKDKLIPATGKMMMDLTVLALACDLTRVATIQWMDSQANNAFPWLNLNDTHHGYQHDRGYQPDAIRKINNWYAGQFAYLLDQMIAKTEGAGSLLDNSLVFWCTEISQPSSHDQEDMPLMLAGGAGGRLRPNRWLSLAGRSHIDLLVSILQAFGQEVSTYGRPGFSKGPVPGLV